MSELLNSKETEMSVLGSIMYDATIFPKLLTALTKEDFFYPEHGRVFDTMKTLHDDGLDINVKSVWNSLYARGYSGITETELRDMLGYRVDGEALHAFSVQLSEFSGHRLLESGIRSIQNDLSRKQGTLDSYCSSLGQLIRQVTAKDTQSEFSTGADIVNSFMELLSRERSPLAYTGIPMIDDRLVDFDAKEISYIAARPGTGKALSVDAPVLTPTGWVRMGDIREGDLVIGGDGTQQRVSGVFPQGLRDEYEIEFSDGTVATSDLEHLWVTENRLEERGFKPRTTEKIMNTLRSDGGFNHTVPYVGVVDFEPREITVEPYTLGLYLGRGSSSGLMTRIITGEAGQRGHLEDHYSGEYLPNGNTGTYRFSRDLFSQLLSDLGLNGVRSRDKFIPGQYLYNTAEVRLSVLQGLLDTEGHVGEESLLTYTTTSPRLRDDVMELVRSLGGRSSYLENNTISISLPEGISPFRHEERSKLYRPGPLSAKHITDVRETGRRVEMQCIMVDSDEHTFVTSDYNVTHNTAMMLQSTRVNLEKGFRVGFLSMEMSVAKLTNRLVSSRARFNGEDMLKMNSSEIMAHGDLMEAIEWYGKVPLFIDDSGPFTRSAISQKIRRMVYEHGVDVVYIDYIGLIQMTDSRSRNEQLSEVSRELKGLSSELDIPLVIASQLSRDVIKRGSHRPNLGDLRDSGSLEQDASVVAFLYPDSAAISMGGGDDLDAYLKEEQNVPVKFEIAKQRNGPVFTRDLVFLKPFGRFELRDHYYATYPIDEESQT